MDEMHFQLAVMGILNVANYSNLVDCIATPYSINI